MWTDHIRKWYLWRVWST